jgi:hypothetical protein
MAGIDPTRHGISRMETAMGISVTIIDDSDRVGYAASMTRAGELYMTSVTDMVTKVLAYLASYSPPVSPHAITAYAMSHGRVPLPTPPAPGTTKMSRLNVLDHGNSSGVEIGTDWVTTASFATYQPTLARLAPKFDTGAFGHLQHCEAGMNLRLMEMFADTFGVPVVAGRGYQNPLYRLNTGNFVRVYPVGPTGTRPPSDTFFWGPSGQ